MESPVDVLTRWEDHGAEWRVVSLGDDRAIVDLCTCYGEPVERLESGDLELITFLRERQRREPPASPESPAAPSRGS